MMDSPPQLSPPPELKSSLDPSELVRELTGEHRADNAAEVDASVDLGPGSRRTTRTENTKFQQNIAVFQCMLDSLRASRGCLNGHPSAPKVVSCDVTTRSFPIFLKRAAWD